MQQISSVLHISTSEETEPIPVVTDNPSAISGIYLVIDTNRHSRLTKLLRVTAYVLHFINNTKMPSQKTSGLLTATEFHNTQRPWIKAAQQEVFTKEFDDLKSTTNSQLPLTSLFEQRFSHLLWGEDTVSVSTKFLYLLPRKNILTELIIRDSHET